MPAAAKPNGKTPAVPTAGKAKAQTKAVDESDFNPGFTFDFGATAEPAQAPWEFAGALKQALKDQTGRQGTSIDHKIQDRLRASDKSKTANKQPQNGKWRAAHDSDDDSDGDDGSSDDGSDGKPLPGERDDDDDDDDDDALAGDDEDDDDDMVGNGEAYDIDDDDDDNDDNVDEEEVEELAHDDGELNGIEDSDEEMECASDNDNEEDEEEEDKDVGEDGVEGAQEKEEEDVEQPKKRQRMEPGTAGSVATATAAAAAASSKGRKVPGGGFYAETPEGTTFSAASFADLNLSRPLLKACAALGYTMPTPIQAACIPLALTGRDICGSAITGSGKTAAFTLPILERLLHRPRQVAAIYVLILTPTRELAVQVHSMAQKLAQFTDIQAALIVGGLSSQVQAGVLRKSPEIVVATPGRIIDHLRNTQSVGLEDLSVMVLDEADRLLEMGFKDEITEIVRMAPKKRQTMLFSATFTEEVRKLMALSLKQPVRLAADAAAAVPRELTQEIIRLKGSQSDHKEAVLLSLCSRSFKGGRTIVFFRTKQRAHRMKILFGLCKLPPAAELHGDMTQAARLESLERFRKGEAAFLLCTDVAARGLDILGVQVIINFDAPSKLQTYLHRIGRTARAGASGQSVTLVEDVDRNLIKEIVKRTKANLRQRVVPPQAVEQWQAQIEARNEDVQRIYREERLEKELRKAEMETNKLQNMLEHEDEIKARPQRTWFISERQKKEIANKARLAAQGQEVRDDDDDMEEDEAKRNKAKAKQEKKNEKRARLKVEALERDGKKRDKVMEETEAHSRAIKSVKSKVRELVQQQGISSAKAAKIAAASISGLKAKKKIKKKGTGGSELFSGDGIHKPGTEPGGSPAKGKRASKADGGISGGSGQKAALSKVDLNRLKRGGKGKAAFKSKARFKRRRR